jgi:hypothetical protein
MPAENFRAEPNRGPSSAASTYDGINPKKKRAVAVIIYLATFEILFFFMTTSAEDKKPNVPLQISKVGLLRWVNREIMRQEMNQSLMPL